MSGKQAKALRKAARTQLEVDPTIGEAQAFADKSGTRLRNVRNALLGPINPARYAYVGGPPKGSQGPADMKKKAK